MSLRKDGRQSGHSRSAAVELGPTAVRVVEVEITGASVRLLKRGIAPLPAGCWEDLPAMRDRVAQAIRTALSGAGITASHVVASLPRRVVTLKYAKLPHAEPDQIRGMVQYEAQQYIPFPIDDVVLDHEIVSDETDEMTTVMIVAARRSLVEELLAAFDSIGIGLSRITVSSLGLAEHAQDNPMPVALLDVSPGSMDMAVVSDGRMIYSRSAALAESNGSGEIDAGAFLAGEVARSLAAYQTEHRGKSVSGVQIACPPGDAAALQASLEGLLEIPVTKVHSSLLAAGDVEALAYATSIGLAASADVAGNRLNLIPRSRAEKKLVAKRRAQTGAGMIVAAIAALAAIVFISHSLSEQRLENSRAFKENQRADTAQQAVNRVKVSHDKLVRTYQTLIGGLDRKTPVVEVLKSVSDSVPNNGGIHLTQLSVERTGTISLHGNAKNETAATDLVLALQGAGPFTEVRLGYLGDAQTEVTGPGAPGAAAAPKAKPGENMTFIVTCKMRQTEVPQIALAGGPSSGTNPGNASKRPILKDEAALDQRAGAKP